MGMGQYIGRIVGKQIAKAYGLDDLFLSGGDHIAFTGIGAGSGSAQGVDDAYSSSWIAYACIVKQARDIAGAPLLLLRDPMDNDSAVPGTDRLAKLINKPHPSITSTQLIEYMVTMLRLRGACFLDFDQPVNPTRIIPWRDPLYWKAIVDDQTETVAAWEYRKSQRYLVRMPSEVVVCRSINPTSPWGWQSPLAAAANPLKIDRDGDNLNARTISQGGQAGPVYKTGSDLSEQKYQQLISRITGRQSGAGEPPRPMILTNGLDVVDPKFTKTDLQILENQAKSAEKICAVYGMTPAQIFKDDTPNRATFETRSRIYWTETLIPIMTAIEQALDSWTVPNYGLYCRFDTGMIPALRADLLEQVKVAKVLHSMQIPVAAINERLELGLDLTLIPGADSALVASSLVPVEVVLSADYSAPDATPTDTTADDPQKSIQRTAPAFKVTNALIRARHKDAVAIIARGKARSALEARMERGWRAELVKWRGKAVKAATDADGNVGALRAASVQLSKDMAASLVEVAAPVHRQAAVEGALSILDLISQERFYGTDNADIFRKTPELPGDAIKAIQARQNYIKTIWVDNFWDDILEKATAAVVTEDGPTASVLAGIVRSKFNTTINQANLIGRQEVGTAFNASRFGTMKSQQIDKHEWLTAGDELVRGNDPSDLFSHVSSNGDVEEIGKKFDCGLAYPQEDGGAAGNVINCRCLTLPVVEG